MTEADTNNNYVNLRREEVIEKITKWLNEDGCVIEVSNDQKLLDRHYYYAYVSLGVNHCAVYLPRNRPDNLVIGVNFVFRSEDMVLFNRLTQAQKNKFIFDLQLSFIQSGVRGAIVQGTTGNITAIRVLKVIYFDALTKHLLLTYVHDVFEASYMAMIKFGQFRDSMWPEGANRPTQDYGGYFSSGQ